MSRRTLGGILAPLAASFVVVALSGLAQAQPVRLGAMGDSLSDEYLEETYGSYARNWPLLLASARGVNFGPTAAQAGQPGNTWGEPRRTQNRFNFARYGADSASLLTQGQHTGLAALAQSGDITHAVVAIGQNDFAPALFSGAYWNIYQGTWSTATINAYVASRVANITLAADTAINAGARVMVSGIVDYGVSPLTRSFFTNATRRNNVTAVINQVNAQVRNFAQQRRIVYLDLPALGTAIFGTNTALRSTILVGGVTINLNQSNTAANARPAAAFVDDSVHPMTTLQGAFANVVAAGLTVGYGAGVAPLSDQEIIARSPGLTYGSETLEAQLGRPYAGFIADFTCKADFDGSGFADSDDFILFVDHFERGCTAVGFSIAGPDTNCTRSADTDLSGFVDSDDFIVFSAQFDAGC